jgi:hypothetical protein
MTPCRTSKGLVLWSTVSAVMSLAAAIVIGRHGFYIVVACVLLVLSLVTEEQMAKLKEMPGARHVSSLDLAAVRLAEMLCMSTALLHAMFLANNGVFSPAIQIAVDIRNCLGYLSTGCFLSARLLTASRAKVRLYDDNAIMRSAVSAAGEYDGDETAGRGKLPTFHRDKLR